MIELARHIEILLLENDCVIIPDFGGFIAHYQPARYIKEENLYLPPVRTIGFNPQLTINDGLLVQSYMQAHHTDFPDATRMIEEEVAGLKEQLYQNGCAEMRITSPTRKKEENSTFQTSVDRKCSSCGYSCSLIFLLVCSGREHICGQR